MQPLIRTDAMLPDFDSYVDTQAADTEVLRFDGTPFSALVSSCSNLDVTVRWTRTTGPMIRRGSTPEHRWMFGLSRRNSRPVHWCGHEVGVDPVVGFFPGDFENIVKSGFESFGISIADSYFQQVADREERHISSRTKSVIGGSLVNVSTTQFDSLCRRIEVATTEGTNEFDNQAFDLARQVVAIVARAPRHRPSIAARRRTYERARAYMTAHARDDLRVSDIVRNVGCSSRTLAYAFREHAGVSPMRYVKVFRLNRVRTELQRANASDAIVADVANGWGFWHLGDFAADYRRLFGCLPSEDLQMMRKLVR